jgi:hypothetical protein
MAKSQLRQYVFTPGNAGAGTVEVPGKIDLQQLLIITNTTSNQIIYNFADPVYSGTTVTFNRANDSSFPTALDNADGTTTITLSVSTSTQSSTDKLQIFYEQPYQYVRIPEVGTDAFERTRVAPPQSMLDADFEYGLQPTKWLTISQQRGYPSIYEIPGTDIAVTAVTTDASSGAGGLSTAESVITVTTGLAHGYSVGTPFTIKGMNSAIIGYDRSEGSFIVYQVLSSTQFTYIAKGKVGFTSGDNIWTAFVQLRQGGFYTGSSINAVINTTALATNSSGNLVTVGTTAGMTVGSPVTLGQVITNCIATSSSGNQITLGTTLGLAVGMPMVFSGSSFGGITSGTTYYVLTIVDTKTITMSTTQNGSVFVPTTAQNGNMNVTAGASFGGLVANNNTAGNTYYITSIPTPGTNGTVTLSTNLQYTTTITNTNSITNGVKFANYTYQGQTVGGTTNMTVGESVAISGSTIGNLVAGTYYIYQILDNNYAILTATQGGAPFVQTTAAGSMNVTVGTNVTLTTVAANSGFLSFTAVCPPTFTFSTPATTAGFTASLSGSTLTVTSVASGSLAVGQAIALSTGNTVPSGTVILAQVSGTTGQAGQYTVTTSTGSISSNANFISVATQATITVNTTTPHGLVAGDTINVVVTSDNGTNNHLLANGPFFVESTTANTVNGQSVINQFTYTARGVGILTSGTTILAQLYARPDSYYSHRPFDGGVQLGTGLPSYGSQAIRMSKKYIRYQSGKGINFNTGLLMAPNYFVRSVYANGTTVGSTVTVVTDDVDHGMQVGATFTLSGVTTSGYNGTYVVSGIIDERTIQFVSTNVLGSAQGAIISDPCLLSLVSWGGAAVRSGTYDEQNGVFWQYDGQVISCVRRSSTFQLAGTITVIQGSGQIIGQNTRFTSQLYVGCKIVIRGMSHTVTHVISDTLMYVNPQWRGANSVSGIKATRTIDYVVPQSKWNVDRCDGSNGPYNPSGYQINPSKMQMVGLQWTWYGAGFIDWMIRGPEGRYITVHRLRNNNLNNEAWMRAGNMPVRFEVSNEGGANNLAQNVLVGETNTIYLNDVSSFPASGTIMIDNEFITYGSKSASLNTLNYLARAQPIAPWATGGYRTFTAGAAAAHSAGTGVVVIGQTASPVVSHWGAAFVQDGGFDSDRSYIFNYSQPNVNISTKKTTAFAVRLAPSVSNALPGDLGQRELINRASFLLQQLESSAGTGGGNAALVIEGIINPSNMPTPSNISFASLNSIANPTGQPSFSQVATGSTMVFAGAVNNYLIVPIALPLGSTTIPLTLNPATQAPAVSVADDIFFPSTTGALNGLTRVSTLATSSATFTSTISTSTTASITTGSIAGTVFTATTVGSGTLQAGMVLSGGGIATGTYLVAPIAGGTGSGSTWTVSISQTTTAGSSTATLYALSTTIGTGTILVGSAVTGGTIAAGTYIANQVSGTTGGTGVYALINIAGNTPASGQNPTGSTYYGVTVNQGVITFVPSTSTGTVINISRNTYALPGETVFSYINAPANKDALDLTAFKELTNTPIGGRGCYPNGCDVLFVNAYITQGSPINQNLVLRWGEAQA